MTSETQTRTRNEPAERTFGRLFGRAMKQHPKADARVIYDTLRLAFEEWAGDAALREQTRITVEHVIDAFGKHDPYCAFERYPGSHIEPPDPCTCGLHFLQDYLAALPHDSTPGEER